MKKIFAIALAILMMLSVVLGCSGKKETPPAKSTATVTQAQQKDDSKVNAASDQAKAEKKNKENKQEKKTYNQNANNGQAERNNNAAAKVDVVKGKAYTDRDHVAAYIHVFKTLPPNYITKGQANKLGWKTKGTLDQVAPGKSIGGDRYGNYEKKLPDKQGRTWKECDIDYVRGNRNAKRICFSNDGLIYYTSSHYQMFERLY